MDVQPLSDRTPVFPWQKGILILLISAILLNIITAFASPPSPLKIVPGISRPQETARINQSQEILKAIFLEQRYRYVEAKKIWETLSQNSESVADHIFMIDLIDQKSLGLETIPITKASILIAVSYLKWQKKWIKAYQLLKKHPTILAKNEDLRLIEVELALYLRKYEEAELLLLEISPQDVFDKMQFRLLWSWYYALSGKTRGLKTAIDELEENALYLPASIVLIEHWSFPWPETKKRALKALTRFPSDRELFEEIVLVFQHHEAWEEIGNIITESHNIDSKTAAWVIKANVYFQMGLDKKLKQLLNTVPDTERHRIEFLDFLAGIAVRGNRLDRLKHILDKYHKYYPYLQDGDLYLTEYLIRASKRAK